MKASIGIASSAENFRRSRELINRARQVTSRTELAVKSSHDDGSVRVAIVHQYLRVDGSFGGSGRPDPKELTEDGVIYYCN
jgi:hypothetical protein